MTKKPAGPRFSTAAKLAAATLAAVALTACESPLSPVGGSSRFGEQYTQSLLLRAVLDADTLRMTAPTHNSGVQEYARVDSKGLPDSTPTYAVTPAGAANMPEETAGFPKRYVSNDPTVGLVASQLHDAEGNIRVSLQECLARAMTHSLDIAVEAYNPAIKELQIIEAESIYAPVLSGNHQFSNIDEPGTLAASERGINFNNRFDLTQQLPTGGKVQASLGDNYFDLNPPPGFAGIMHGHAPFIALSLAHPLLRGAGVDVTNANIYLAQRDHSISLAQFRRRVIGVCADVEEAYHNLVLATTAEHIQEQLLADTENTRKRVYDRRNIDADSVAYFQSVSAVESRAAELIRARSAVRTASDKLKGLINDPELDLASNNLLVPTDRPTSEPAAYNVAEVIDIALRQRTELQEARLQIERADIIVDVSRNDLLPKADVNLSVQSNGGIYESDITNAFYSTFNSPHFIDYNMGLKWEQQIGSPESESRYKQRLLERRRALTDLVDAAQKVVQDVKLQLREVFTSYEEISARERARAAAARELNGLTKQEDIKPLTPEFLRLKLDSQQRLANAELAEIGALVAYNVAIARLEQAKGTLLEYNRVAINKQPTETSLDKLWLLGKNITWTNPLDKK